MCKSGHKFQLGETLKDKITGIEGVAMVRANYYTGCIHYGIQPKLNKNGSLEDWIWLDETRLVKTKKKIIEIGNRSVERLTSGPDQCGPAL